MSNKKVSFKIPGGLSIILFLVFLILKLTQTSMVADWSWWWVTCPLWIPIATVFAVWIVILVIYIIALIFSLILEIFLS